MPKSETVVHNIGELMAAINKIDRELDERLEREFGDDQKNERELRKTMWFRGHGDRSWSTIPSVQRSEKYTQQLERELVNRFRIRASQLLENAPEKDDYSGWMSLMQHYGLATRLMDWSKSPLIAAYFATENDIMKEDGTGYADACIWILWPSLLNRDQIHSPYIYPCDSTTVEEMLAKAFKSQHFVENENLNRRRGFEREININKGMPNYGEFQPIGYGRIVACEPVEHNLRMYSQQACFTVHDTKEDQEGNTVPKLSELAKTVKNEKKQLLTTRLIIPHDAKQTFRDELRRLGITKSFIYPDLDHLSGDIKRDLL